MDERDTVKIIPFFSNIACKWIMHAHIDTAKSSNDDYVFEIRRYKNKEFFDTICDGWSTP